MRNIRINANGTSTIRINCLDEEHARSLFAEAERPGDEYHNVELMGDALLITYSDLRYPMDVAEVGFTAGHVTDCESSDIMSSVQWLDAPDDEER